MSDTNPFEERTLYTINNKQGDRTTITLDKLTADALQVLFPDVHAWIQRTYDLVVERKPNLGRREHGDLVRALANKEAHASPIYRRMIDDLL